jgi:hypothetical protein
VCLWKRRLKEGDWMIEKRAQRGERERERANPFSLLHVKNDDAFFLDPLSVSIRLSIPSSPFSSFTHTHHTHPAPKNLCVFLITTFVTTRVLVWFWPSGFWFRAPPSPSPLRSGRPPPEAAEDKRGKCSATRRARSRAWPLARWPAAAARRRRRRRRRRRPPLAPPPPPPLCSPPRRCARPAPLAAAATAKATASSSPPPCFPETASGPRSRRPSRRSLRPRARPSLGTSSTSAPRWTSAPTRS